MEMTPQEKQRSSKLTPDDQLKLQAIMQMMQKEKNNAGIKEIEGNQDGDDEELSPEELANKHAGSPMKGRMKEDEEEGYKDGIKENYQMDGETYERIDGLINRELKRKFIFAFEDLYNDLIGDGDQFFKDDVLDYLTIQLDKEINIDELKEDEIKAEGDSIVDEHEFYFFQKMFGEKYSEAEIEAFLKSNDYQEELKYSDLEERDFANWDNALDYFVGKSDSRGGRLDESIEFFNRIAFKK
tara:strand:- start:29897 stop:30619 length:723 start_codon:yes stop_codon:yes gene_type:complete